MAAAAPAAELRVQSVNVSPDLFLALGLDKMGVSDRNRARLDIKIKEQKFKDHFRVSPTVCSNVFRDIQNFDLADVTIKKVKASHELVLAQEI
jgi:hypothetical protein